MRFLCGATRDRKELIFLLCGATLGQKGSVSAPARRQYKREKVSAPVWRLAGRERVFFLCGATQDRKGSIYTFVWRRAWDQKGASIQSIPPPRENQVHKARVSGPVRRHAGPETLKTHPSDSKGCRSHYEASTRAETISRYHVDSIRFRSCVAPRGTGNPVPQIMT